MLNSLNTLLKELHKLKEEKRNWKQARLAFDAAASKLEAAQEKGAKDIKVKESEAEYNAMKANFEKADRQYKKQINLAMGKLKLVIFYESVV